MSLKDAVATLVDGKIRHEYDRHKATRTPNSAGIHWQKPGLRTGESHDNLRGLLKQAASAHAVTEFDDLDRRLVELQDNLKAVRLALVNEVRAVRVSKWGEEYQEFSFKRGGGGCGGGGGTDLRLGPPCGDSLEHCRCSQESPPGPVEKGSLGTTVAAAAEAAAAAAAAISENEEDIRRDIVGAAAEHEGRRVARGGGNDTGQRFANAGHISRSTARGGTRGGRFSGGNSSSTDPGDGLGNGSLDEIKRQMGKNPLDLERKRKALDAEMLEGESAGKGGLRRSGSGRRYGDIALDDAAGGSDVDRGISSVLVSRDKQSMHATTGLKAADNGGQDKHIVGDTEQEKNGEDGAESTEGWKDELMGMQPHERAEVYESKGMYREALRWHRQDLAAARERVQDGEEEDDRTAGLDLARALRNTGRCLGKLDMEGFAE
ncbi:unnamed protein product, partial [Sphacelaria rigidula]